MKVKQFNNLNEVIGEYGKVALAPEDMVNLKLNHVIVKGEGEVEFTLILNETNTTDIINGNYNKVVEETIPNYKGVYGYYGNNEEGMVELAQTLEIFEEEEKFIVVLKFNGSFFQVNSGLNAGKVIIPISEDTKFELQEVYE